MYGYIVSYTNNWRYNKYLKNRTRLYGFKNFYLTLVIFLYTYFTQPYCCDKFGSEWTRE